MRTPLTLVKSAAEDVAATRSCGPCTACCTLPRIKPEEDFPQGKPGYTKCEHLCESGCSKYDDRPALCRDYQCLWRAGIVLGDERERPDRLGLMLTLDGSEDKIVFDVWELWDGAAENNPGRWFIERLVAKGGFPVNIRFYGVPCSINHNTRDCFGLGGRLSLASQYAPKELAAWLEWQRDYGTLRWSPEEEESVKLDLAPLLAGVPVERHYKKGG